MQGARREDSAGVLDGTSRNPTERNAADVPVCAAAAEIPCEMRVKDLRLRDWRHTINLPMGCRNSGPEANCSAWRGVRVVEGARLESVCRGNLTEGSNPSLSASTYKSNNLAEME